ICLKHSARHYGKSARTTRPSIRSWTTRFGRSWIGWRVSAQVATVGSSRSARRSWMESMVMISTCRRASRTGGRGVVWGDRWLPPRSGCRSVAMVVAGAVALAATGGCGADDPVPDDQVPVTETRYEPVTSRICDALDVEGIADDIEAIGSADSSFRSISESSYASRVTCRTVFSGVDDRYDHHDWEFDPWGHVFISVYHDHSLMENEHRSLVFGERRAVENQPGATLECI